MVSRLLLLVALALAAVALAACGPRPVAPGDFNTRLVTLPDGTRVRCEMMIRPEDMARGMMFRDSLAEDRGMLFFHSEPGRYTYWMYQVRIPLDIVWMDGTHRIVEMSPDTPPCRSQVPQECPSYGGTASSMIVLELAAGSITRHGLRLGQQIAF